MSNTQASQKRLFDFLLSAVGLFNADNEIRIIGIPHGEKLYETLASSEELCRSEVMGDYYRVSFDDRDLNYSKYFTEGDVDEAATEDYHSHNTYQLDAEELKALLLKLPEVRAAFDSGQSGSNGSD